MRIIFELLFSIMSSVTLHYLGALDHVVLQLELMAYRIDISFFSFYFLLADMCFANLLYVRPKKKKKNAILSFEILYGI